MSKTFILKRNPSPDGTPVYRPPEIRSRSLSRDLGGTYSKNFFSTDFGVSSSLPRCPVHDVGGKNGRELTDGRTSLVDRHQAGYTDWLPTRPASMPRHGSFSYDVEGSGPSGRKGSPATRHKDLKRKMVFDLHKEIRKPIHTTHLEEISDMDRITDICMTTLKAMMECKKQRKFLHHMNNNALPLHASLLPFFADKRNISNNSASTSSASIPVKKRKDSTDPRNVFGGSYLNKARGSQKGHNKAHEILAEIQGKLEAAQAMEQDMAEDMDKGLAAGKSKSKIIQHKPKLMSPEEILNTKWIRLSKEQVEVLEELMRADGKEPGLHAHSDVSGYDVFREIRDIRHKRDALEENPEEEDAVTELMAL